MLRLSDEIGIMADNISLQADKILDTQEAMNSNVAEPRFCTPRKYLIG